MRATTRAQLLERFELAHAATTRAILQEREAIPGGRAAGMKPKQFPKKQLKMGVKVEHEHSPKTNVAREIAMDHLTELPD